MSDFTSERERESMTYFRRRCFPMAPDRQPKWHILDEVNNHTREALCGYSYRFILETPMQRPEVKTKKLICARCARKQEEKELLTGLSGREG